MKLPRLIEIVTILLNRKTITASELAERFGVSIRTIYRDIEVLSSAGIPIYTTQGVNGGISIMEEYSLNRTMLSENDKNSILFALHSLRSTKYPEVDAVLEKLSGIFQSNVSDWINVDFSPWGSNPNANSKFVDIKNAILKCKVIEIDYINTQSKKTTREIEPLRLSFKHQAWYLWAWCRQREDFRTFRISRIKRVKITNETFDRMCERTSKSAKNQNAEVVRKVPVHCVLQFTEGALYRLYDDYDDTEIHDNGDGTYTIEVDFPEDDWVYGYILSFGSHVKVIEPQHIREIIKEKARRIAEFYD
jgi:predicted DNA-binding transcriptional regulator YafY